MKDSPLRKKKNLKCLYGSVATLALAAVCSADAKLAPIAGSLRHNLTGYFTPAYSDPNERVDINICLVLKDAAGLQKFVDSVNDAHSPNYHKFKTPQELGVEFGADTATVDFVVNYLKENGISVTLVGKSRTNIMAHGTVAQMEKAFHTTIAHVKLGDGNIRTNLTPLEMPSEVAGKILNIEGVDTSMRMLRKGTPTSIFHPPLYWGCYNMNPARSSGFYGQGRNIAYVNWDGLRLNNLPYWYSAFGLPTPQGSVGSNVHLVPVGTFPSYYDVESPYGEGDLDVQMITMAAPLANVLIYDGSPYDSSLQIDTYLKVQDDNLADIVSESYGWSTYIYTYDSTNGGQASYDPQDAVAAHNVHLLMSAQGITYLSASGDYGTGYFNNGGGTSNVTRYAYPDIEPEVLVVGGSEATVDSTTGVRSVEKSWGLNGGIGGTGGFDPYDTPALGFTMNTPPSFQTTGLPSQTTTYPYRLVPDVAAQAGGGDGVTTYAWIIYYNQGNSSYPPGTQVYISGTSAASPATAGSLGIVEQRLFNGVTPNSTRSNVRLGRIADYLYLKGGQSSVFYDITQGTSVGNLPGTSIPATPAVGWDYATGWGALNFDGLYHSYLQGKQP